MRPGYVRPTLTAQVSPAEYQQLERLCEVLHMNKAKVIRMAVSRLAAERLPEQERADAS